MRGGALGRCAAAALAASLALVVTPAPAAPAAPLTGGVVGRALDAAGDAGPPATTAFAGTKIAPERLADRKARGLEEPERSGLAAPLIPVGFDTLTGGSPLVSPPDPTGAVGRDYVLAAVNVKMALYDRDGSLQIGPIRLRNLADVIPDGVREADPRIVFDRRAGVFVLTFITFTATKGFIEVLVIPEETATNQNTWCLTHMNGDRTDGDGRQVADYPAIGFTRTRFTITTNNFSLQDERFRFVQVISMAKRDLYDCSVPVVPLEIFAREDTRNPDGTRAFTLVPAHPAGTATRDQYLVSLHPRGTASRLVMWRLGRFDGDLVLRKVALRAGTTRLPPYGLQCGGAATREETWWDTGDLRLTGAWVDAVTGTLSTATAVRGNPGGGPPESVIRWWEVSVAGPLDAWSVLRRGTIGNAGRDAAWPVVGTLPGGDLVVAAARAGLDECLSVPVWLVPAGSKVEVPLGVTGVGEARYEYSPGVERWGDYQALAPDPGVAGSLSVFGAYPLSDGSGPTPRFRAFVTSTDGS